MPAPYIDNQEDFEDFCRHARESREVGFDTEFVSESTFKPELCLLQMATRERGVVVDPFAVPDLSSWWKLMADPAMLTIVHGGREEIRFCLNLFDQRPARIVDVQLAEGLLGRSYPLNYSALVTRVLGKGVQSHETRTDWKRRPLTERQIEYALDDVQHLLPIWQKQKQMLTKRGRLEWAETEFERMILDAEDERTRENWRRLPGIQSLRPRELAVVRELYNWRTQQANTRNKPARRILRDDLVIELARRQPKTMDDLLATRDMNRADYRRAGGEMLECIARAVALPAGEWPTIQKNEKDQDEQILAQLLAIALANRCAQSEVAQGLVGTVADLRHLVRWEVYGERQGPPPKLTQGWRSDVCGTLLTDVLAGRVALRINDPKSDHPLKFEDWPGEAPKAGRKKADG